MKICSHSTSECGREHLSPCFDYKGSQWDKYREWCTKANILHITAIYLTVTKNRKSRKWKTGDWNRRVWPNPGNPVGWRVRVRVWPANKVRVGFMDGSGPELNRFSCPNPDRWQVTRTRCYHYPCQTSAIGQVKQFEMQCRMTSLPNWSQTRSCFATKHTE